MPFLDMPNDAIDDMVINRNAKRELGKTVEAQPFSHSNAEGKGRGSVRPSANQAT